MKLRVIFITLLGILVSTINCQAQDIGWSDIFTESNGIDGTVNALAIDADSNLWVGGVFAQAGDVSTDNIAFWNGIEWSAVGNGLNGSVEDIEIDATGNIYVGGRFTASDTLSLKRIAMWDGNRWHSLGGGFEKEPDLGTPTAVVWDLEFGNDDKLYVGGDFTEVNDSLARGVAVWNGSIWEELGGGVSGEGCLDLTLDNVYSIHASDSGDIYVGGDFREAGGVPVNGLAKWNGAEWLALGSGVGSCDVLYDIIEYKDEIYVGGSFREIDNVQANGIAVLNGAEWGNLEGGVSGSIGSVRALTVLKDDVYVAGDFLKVGDVDASKIAKWTSVGWQSLGSGISSPGFLNVIAARDADVFVGGFKVEEAGGVPSFGLGLWRNRITVSSEEETDKDDAQNINLTVFPNPVANFAKIQFSSLENWQVKIQVFSVLGSLIDTVFEGRANLGINIIDWNASSLPAGVYVIRIYQRGRPISSTMIKI